MKTFSEVFSHFKTGLNCNIMFSSIPNIVFILIVSVVQNIFILARFTEFLIVRIKPV